MNFYRREIVKCKAERHDWIKRWHHIEEICCGSSGSRPDGHLNYFDNTNLLQDQR